MADDKVNGGDESFIKITNKDVWLKLIEMEKKMDKLSIKLYAFATAVVIIGTFLSVTGGVSLGGGLGG